MSVKFYFSRFFAKKEEYARDKCIICRKPIRPILFRLKKYLMIPRLRSSQYSAKENLP